MLVWLIMDGGLPLASRDGINFPPKQEGSAPPVVRWCDCRRTLISHPSPVTLRSIDFSRAFITPVTALPMDPMVFSSSPHLDLVPCRNLSPLVHTEPCPTPRRNRGLTIPMLQRYRTHCIFWRRHGSLELSSAQFSMVRTRCPCLKSRLSVLTACLSGLL